MNTSNAEPRCPEGGDDKPQAPPCDYIGFPGRGWPGSPHIKGNRCRRPAAVRILYRHGEGIDPEYRQRCLLHTRGNLGPMIGAIWDTQRAEWVGLGVQIL